MDDLGSRRRRSVDQTVVPLGAHPPFGAPPFGVPPFGVPPFGVSSSRRGFAAPSTSPPQAPPPVVTPQRTGARGGPYPVTARFLDPCGAPPVGPPPSGDHGWGRWALVGLVAAIAAVVFAAVVTLVVLLRVSQPGSSAAPPSTTITPCLASGFPDITTSGPQASVIDQCRDDAGTRIAT